MTSKRNVGLIVGVGALGIIAGFALIFANMPVGRALVIASMLGATLAVARPGPDEDERAQGRDPWFGPHRIGFGWGPLNWKGDLVLAVGIVAIYLLVVYLIPAMK